MKNNPIAQAIQQKSKSLRQVFGRLFWKVFLSFWLANMVVMLSITYIILHHNESEKAQQEQQTRITKAIKSVIASRSLRPTNTSSEFRPLKHILKKGKRRSRYLRIEENNTVLFEWNPLNKTPRNVLAFNLKLDDGRQLLISTGKPRLPKPMVDTIISVHKMHLLIMFAVSAILSLGLSWSITNPLRKLGRYSQQFSLKHESEIPLDLRQRPDEIGLLARDMHQMMSTVEITLQSQKQLLHDVSHELRAPLTRLQVAAELVQKNENKNSQHVQRIHQECHRISQLIQSILNFSRIEISADIQPVNLNALMIELLRNARYENHDRTYNFSPPEQSLILPCQKELVRQAVENILSNANKYSPSTCDIDVSITQTKNTIEITIRDRGEGIPISEIPKLTEPFYRGNDKMHGEGFGLGLSITQRAMAAHNGQLLFANHPDGGLSVSLLFPLQT